MVINEEQTPAMRCLQNLLESTVDRGADLVALVEVNRGNGTLADALRSELEFLDDELATSLQKRYIC